MHNITKQRSSKLKVRGKLNNTFFGVNVLHVILGGMGISKATSDTLIRRFATSSNRQEKAHTNRFLNLITNYLCVVGTSNRKKCNAFLVGDVCILTELTVPFVFVDLDGL